MTTDNTLRSRAALMLAVPLAGLLALIVFEVMRNLSTGTYDPAALPPVDMLVGVLSVSTLAVIALCLFAGSAGRWFALVVAVLMTLFHAMHILEHAMARDFSMGVLILITMLIPSGAGAWMIWKLRKAPEHVSG
ncbi:MAG: hypothetical protein AAGA23_17920 [Pseudomonadota bacterium]